VVVLAGDTEVVVLAGDTLSLDWCTHISHSTGLRISVEQDITLKVTLDLE
jgi:hypothetical protein